MLFTATDKEFIRVHLKKSGRVIRIRTHGKLFKVLVFYFAIPLKKVTHMELQLSDFGCVSGPPAAEYGGLREVRRGVWNRKGDGDSRGNGGLTWSDLV